MSSSAGVADDAQRDRTGGVEVDAERGAVPPCPWCHIPLEYLGQVPLRSGGTTGGWHLFLGSLADSGEQILHIDMYRCPHCRRLELYDHDASLPHS